MSSERKDALKKRLDENYTTFIESLHGKTASELIAMASEITAAQQLHEELLDACNAEDVEFLLRFDDPLEVVCGYWESEIIGYDHSGEMGHMLWEIRDRELYPQERSAQTPQDVGGAVQAEYLTERENPMSDVKQITTDDLRQMEDREGLILQGCGGDLQEWVDGINELLTQGGILQAGSVWKAEAVRVFQHDGLTNLLFPFDGVQLDVGKLAVWRLQTHAQFGGTWLSDYVPNRLGGFVQEQRPTKPKMALVGRDGNIFSIMGTASQLLQMAGMHDQNREMIDRVTSCSDYNKALHIISEYVETELTPPPIHQRSNKKKARDAHER